MQDCACVTVQIFDMPETLAFAAIAKIGVNEAVGAILRLNLWMYHQSLDDASLDAIDPSLVETAISWHGSKGEMVRAARESGVIGLFNIM